MIANRADEHAGPMRSAEQSLKLRGTHEIDVDAGTREGGED
jgi:hypothetical protein